MKISIQEIYYFIKHPLIVLEFFFNMLKLTKRSRILNNGERIILKDFNIAKKSNNINYLTHIKRYEWSRQFLQNTFVLDNGCGTGYGTFYLASNKVKQIIGIDISKDAINYAQEKYKSKNLSFKRMNSLSLNFSDDMFDAVVSFGVIEHFEEKNQKIFVSEIARILKQDGLLLIGNPNARLVRLKNPLHKKELTLSEMKAVLGLYFENVKIYGQNFVINGKNLRENWFRHKNHIRYENIEISGEDYLDSFVLIALCKNPIKDYSK